MEEFTFIGVIFDVFCVAVASWFASHPQAPQDEILLVLSSSCGSSLSSAHWFFLQGYLLLAQPFEGSRDYLLRSHPWARVYNVALYPVVDLLWDIWALPLCAPATLTRLGRNSASWSMTFFCPGRATLIL